MASEGNARKAAISLRIFGKSQCEIVVDIFIPLIKNIVLPYVKNNVTRMGNRKKNPSANRINLPWSDVKV